MSLLTSVQYFCRRTNIDVPSTVMGSTDPQILQVRALLEEEGTDLSGRGDWNELTHEATHTTLATEDQGAIGAIATNNFRYIKNGTIWDRSIQLPIPVISGADWQLSKAISLTGPRYRARIRGGKLLSNPVPSAGDTWAFEYVSWNWILDNDGSTTKQYFTEDKDTFLLPEPILIQGLRWRWKKEKGLPYSEDFMTYENMVKDALGRDGMKPVINMGDSSRDVTPGINVPQFNWNV